MPNSAGVLKIIQVSRKRGSLPQPPGATANPAVSASSLPCQPCPWGYSVVDNLPGGQSQPIAIPSIR
ncbi:MAG: hypothetical protein AB2705_00700 [Candidatus Thiodiazotropha sp.]